MIKDYIDSIFDLFNDDEFVEKVEHQIQDNIWAYGTIVNLFESIGLKEDQLLDAVEQSITKYLKFLNEK